MLAWMLYVLVIALLLSGAALAAEHAARLRQARARWIWTVALVAALAIPALVASVAIQAPDLGTPTVSRKVTALRELTPVKVAPLNWVDARTKSHLSTRAADRALQLGWIAMSLVVVVALAGSTAYISWSRPGWRPRWVAAPVRIAPDTSPTATASLARSRRDAEWLLDAPEPQQATHEQPHLTTQDARFLMIGLCTVALMPWNLVLWWQLHRLRVAIEVGRDPRVLESGLEAGQCQAMPNVSRQRLSALLTAVACMTESRSSAAIRRAPLASNPAAPRRRRVLAGALGLLALILAALAAQVAPPAANGEEPVMLTPQVLDSYTGYYVRGGHLVYAITRKDTRLFMQVPNYDYDSTELMAVNETEFTAAGVPVIFVRDAQGQVTELIEGTDRASSVPMPRVDRAAAETILSNNEIRFQGQSPTPGGAAALRRLIEGIVAGSPPYNQMAPWYAELAKATVLSTRAVARMGAVADIEFRGVNPLGADVYEVRQNGGMSTWMIVIAADGRIADADSYIW